LKEEDDDGGLLSKQRVRQVPVSSEPKKLSNLSRQNSDKKLSDHPCKSNKTLSLERDERKKNVYHIFGRETSESQVSVNVKAIEPPVD